MRLLLKFATLIVLMGIAFLSLRTSVELIDFNDKAGHIIAYFILMFVMSLAYWNGRKAILNSFLVSFLYGIMMEVGQYFVPGRSFSIIDMLANGCGSLLAAGILLLFGKKIILLFRIK